MFDTTSNAAETADKVTQSLMQACADASAMTRNSLNAALQSATVLTKGAEEFCESYNSLTQNMLSHSISTGKAVMAARSMRDLMDLQATLIKTGFDFMLAELTRMSEISTRTAHKAVAPMADNLNEAVVKFSRATKAA